jgi:hypothetical protein
MRIVNFGQVVDLDRGGVDLSNQITVELADGRRASVVTDESTIQQLIQLATGVLSQPIHAPRSSGFPNGTEVKSFDGVNLQQELERGSDMSEDDLATIFGGNGEGDPGELHVEPEPVMGRIAEEKLVEAPALKGMGSGTAAPVRRPMVDKDGFAIPISSRTVEQDEMGYPVLEGGQRAASPPPGDDGADDGTQI